MILAVLAAVALGWFGGRSSIRSVEPVAAPAVDAGSRAHTPPPVTKAANAPLPARAASTSSAVVGKVAGPLPPADAPLKQTFQELKSRADAGDLAAASRLYHDLNTCFAADAVMRNNALAAEAILQEKNDADSAEVKRGQVDRAQQYLNGSATLAALCGGVDSGMLNELAAVSLQAAQLGDANARDCYVHRGPFVAPRSLVDDSSSVDTYREQAPALIDSAIAAGDWKMVDMLQYAYGPSGINLIAGLVGPDPIQHYRYLKLFRLGADGPRVPTLDKQLAYAAKQLDARQLAEADAWAQTTQQSYFKGNSTSAVPENWNACAISPE
jgi:hypothetical protein